MLSYSNNIFLFSPGKPEFANTAAELIYLTGQEFFNYIFMDSSGKGKRALKVLSRLYRRSKNLFSYEHSSVLLKEKRPIALVIYYDYETMRREKGRTGYLIVRFLGIKFLFAAGRLKKADMLMFDIGEDDLYIQNIAVVQDYRGIGLGKELIKYVEKEAFKKDKKRIILHVDEENINAIGFYKRMGFDTVCIRRVYTGNKQEMAFLCMAKIIK